MKYSLCAVELASLTIGLLLIGFSPVQAQPLLPDDTPNPEAPLFEPLLPEDLPDFSPEDPPELQFEPRPQPPATVTEPPGVETFRITEIELLDMTVDPAALFAVFNGETVSVSDRIAALVGQQVTLADLLALRTFITEAYINAGYITSGAFLPSQTFTEDSPIQLQIVEGDLEAIQIRGLTQLQEQYIRDRINLRVNQPIRQQAIDEALQLLQLDPLLDRVDAQLLAGTGPGQSILVLDLLEAVPFSGGVSANNYQSPSTGEIQLGSYVSYTNLLGLGDRLDLNYRWTEGLNSYGLSYAVPVNPMDGTLNLNLSTGDSRIIENNFSQLGIRSDSRTASLGFRQPLVRTPSNEVALGLSLDLRRSQTFLLEDIPFSFSVGPENGESKVTVLRFSQDWVNRSSTRVLAARSQFSLGIDAFDATINNTGTDGRFLSWLGQFQWVERLPNNSLFPANSVLVARISSQLTPNSLLPLERFSLGGVNSVRGYRNGQLVTDNGLAGSVELRIPLSANPTELQITPFLEAGTGWNNLGVENNLETLASVGLGLRWAISPENTTDPRFQFRLDYGHPLIRTDRAASSIQDAGLYFSLDIGI
jgi:hemolysin activation/secretion protein